MPLVIHEPGPRDPTGAATAPGTLAAASLAAALAVAAGACSAGPGPGGRERSSGALRAERGVPQPLPPDAFRVEWTPVRVPISMHVGEARAVSVAFKNASAVPWPATGESRLQVVRLSHRWWRGDEASLFAGYGRHRVDLRAAVMPGETATLTDTITAPRVAGDYVLEFDLVQEGTAWFGDRGGAKKLVLVKVRE